jgi:hypothetical protein
MGTHARIGTGMMRLMYDRGHLPKISSMKKTPMFSSSELNFKI